ncbi:pheromone alpha factor receptor [Kalmusia sp. IMI 367209]|nr:pheromone alpha factor receptor [Kalmusia sp. IMI 367209]
MSTAQLPTDFDPYTQEFILLASDGSSFTTTMGEINFLRQYGIRIAINWATQIGACGILLLVLLLLTKREKRNSSIFIMNALCLILNTIRSILQCLWLTTSFFHPYALVSGDFSRVTASDRANSIASNTLMLILVACILVSLSMQVWVVSITAQRLQRWIIMSITTLVALIAIGYRFAVTVISNMQTMRDESMMAYSGYVTGMNITFAVSVWVYSCVFTFKLGHALLERKRLRMTQFGPMQIIFIMGCQTMIIPAIFTSLNFYDSVPELASQSTTIICIFLPLSAIWAGLVTNDANIGARGADSHQRLFKHQFYRTPLSTNTSPSSYGEKTSLTTSTMIGSGKEPESPGNSGYHQTKDSVNNGIYMHREWNVETGEASQQV